jgi:hypothetical protein
VAFHDLLAPARAHSNTIDPGRRELAAEPGPARATTMGRWLAGAPRPAAGLTAVAERAASTPEHRHLLARFPALRAIPLVRERAERAQLRLHCWFYDTGTGTGAVSRWRGEGHVPSFGEL